MSRRARSIERSDSSASTTSHSPAPQPALEPLPVGVLSSPPTSQLGSIPHARRMWTAMLVVVVLPCVPATAIVGRRELIWASSSER